MKPAGLHWMVALRNFAAGPTDLREECDLCGGELKAAHAHLFERDRARLQCACSACALLLADGDGRYQRVPERVLRLDDSVLTDVDWAALRLPIALAFFVRRGSAVVAMYPGPAGVIESALDLSRWSGVCRIGQLADGLQENVEALLVNRIDGARDCYLVPIDRCYRMVGLIRRQWRGLAGGSEIYRTIDEFFAELQKLAQRGDHTHA